MSSPTEARPPRVRRAVRVLPVDRDGAVLLLRCATAAHPTPFLITVGGGIEDGESERDAAVRELWEETGIVRTAEDLVGPVHEETFTFRWDGDLLRQHQHYYLLPVEHGTPVDFTNLEEIEAVSTVGHGWWTAAQLRTCTDIVLPDVLRAVEAAATALEELDPPGRGG
jgi:8-oxo-dGTP pyrophosphatase MutT (NUDIX family)